jgi:thiamine biosynthesis lipoprotein
MISPRPSEFHRFAHEAFRELDRLEAILSRFNESSDVSQINCADVETPVAVSFDTFACLKLALWISRETNGAFDITEPDSGLNHIDLSEETLSVTLCRPGLNIDLGGVGESFALDCMAGILEQWEVKHSLLLAGDSTALALDAPARRQGWPIQFGSGKNARQVNLYQNSFAGSGLALKGEHIVDPRSRNPVTAQKRAWVLAPNAALSPRLS